MKIELIDENRIKVILSCYDILELNFDISSLSVDANEARLLFKDILKEAEDKFGFSAKVDRIMIETVPTPKEGYIIYITKLTDNLSIMKRHREDEEVSIVFCFLDFLTLKSAVKAVDNIFYGSSDLFRLDSKYYLVLDSVLEENFRKAEAKLTDFGDKIVNSPMFEAVLNEYGKILYKKNAINMIKNKKN